MYCKYCGNELSDNAIFCSHCGKQFIEDKEKTSSSSFPKKIYFSYINDHHGLMSDISYKIDAAYFEIVNSIICEKLKRDFKEKFSQKTIKAMKEYQVGSSVEIRVHDFSSLAPVMPRVIHEELTEFFSENNYRVSQIGQAYMGGHATKNDCIAEKSG